MKVGPDEVPFGVHKDLLCQYSTFFRNALNGGFKESKENTVKLPTETPAMFRIIVDWLYYQRLPKSRPEYVKTVAELDVEPHAMGWLEDEWTETAMLIRVYIFAEKYHMGQLKCEVLLRQELDDPGYNAYETVIKAYKELPENSKLLDEMAAGYATSFVPSHDSLEEATLRKAPPNDFLVRVMIMSGKIRNSTEYKPVTLLHCHEHCAEGDREYCEAKRQELRSNGW